MRISFIIGVVQELLRTVILVSRFMRQRLVLRSGLLPISALNGSTEE